MNNPQSFPTSWTPWTVEKLRQEMDYPASEEWIANQLNNHEHLLSTIRQLRDTLNGMMNLPALPMRGSGAYIHIQDLLKRAEQTIAEAKG